MCILDCDDDVELNFEGDLFLKINLKFRIYSFVYLGKCQSMSCVSKEVVINIHNLINHGVRSGVLLSVILY